MPAKHCDCLNDYVKAYKEKNSEYMSESLGMQINEETKNKVSVSGNNEISLGLKKAMYGLIQAGRLWSKFIHQRSVEIGSLQSITDMYIYFRWRHDHLLIVGDFVDRIRELIKFLLTYSTNN